MWHAGCKEIRHFRKCKGKSYMITKLKQVRNKQTLWHAGYKEIVHFQKCFGSHTRSQNWSKWEINKHCDMRVMGYKEIRHFRKWFGSHTRSQTGSKQEINKLCDMWVLRLEFPISLIKKKKKLIYKVFILENVYILVMQTGWQSLWKPLVSF